MAIAQIITAFPAAPNAATDTPEQFSDKADAFVAHQSDNYVLEVNTWKDEANVLAVTVNSDAASASTSASNALASEAKALKWAENPEDTEVETGKYSALHWAAKAATFNPALYALLTGATFTGQAKGITPIAAEDLTRKDFVEAAGVGGTAQTWQDVTASRASNVVYTNNTGKPIQVAIATNKVTGSVLYILYVDNLPIHSIRLGSSDNTRHTVTTIVPDGITYEFDASTTDVITWHELRGVYNDIILHTKWTATR